ncbi:BRCA1-associated RING domain protein 1 [Holothuria leucospilota]|uniref:BRCA1-associated RING domain protein 1 n=1 Tax=Holothuria leucospilota TaxID=206669 RepID=A0A9Q1BG06_HOLLE|nr:BRCA1-associated RING domain protein 1 [Holothuria leucospilota]
MSEEIPQIEVLTEICHWKNTTEALKELDSALRCSFCGCLLQDPCTLGNCDHLFCRICVKGFVQRESCPSCEAPVWVRDIQSNRELESVVQLFRKLRKIVASNPALPVKISENSTQDEVKEEEDSLIPEMDLSDEEVEIIDEDDRDDDDVGDGTNRQALKDQNIVAGRSQQQPKNTRGSKRMRTLLPKNRPPLIVEDENDPYAMYEIVSPSRKGKKDRTDVGKKKSTEKSLSLPQRESFRRRRNKKSIQKKLEKANNVWNNMKNGGEDVECNGQKRKVNFRESESDIESGVVLDLEPLTDSVSSSMHREDSYDSGKPDSRSSRRKPQKKQRNTFPSKGKSEQGRSKTSKEVVNSHKAAEEAVTVVKPAPIRSIMKRNIRGETPLHVACIKGDLEKVTELLQKGSDPNTKDHAGWTPLHEACNHGFVPIVATLLDNGALINMPGFDNDSPLHDAVHNNRPEVVRLLIERGASLDVRNIHGQTPKDLEASKEVMEALKTKPCVTSDLNTSFNSSISSSPPKFKKIVLLGTGLTDKQKNKLHACARLLQGKVTSDFTQNITHLVTNALEEGRCSRTMKFLQAVLLGKWVVDFSWVEECLQRKGLVPEVNHEICGTTIDSDSEGAKKSREMANSQFPALFDGCHFYLHGNFASPTPPKEELASLIKLGGGTIITRYPKPDDDVIQASTIVPYHATPDSELRVCSYYILYDQGVKRKPPPKVRTAKVCTVPVSWLMDCISSYELKDLPE